MPRGITEHVAVVETEFFKSPNTVRLYDYIVAKRGENVRPQLSDIDMMELYDIAPSMCIRDVLDDGQDLVCRYWGGEFTEAYRIDCTNKLVSETYTPEGVANTLALHHRALAVDLPLRLVGTLGYVGVERDHVLFEGLMISLDGKDGPKQHVLSAGQFRYALDEEDRALLKSQCPELVI